MLKLYRLAVLLCLLIFSLRASAAAPITWLGTSQVAGGGWGRMVHLRNGLWLCVSVEYFDPNGIWQLHVSADSCRTWHTLGQIRQPGRNLGNGQLLQMPDGAILLAGRSVIDDHLPRHGRSYQLPVYVSRNSGGTWTFLSNVDEHVDPPGTEPGLPSAGLWEPFLFTLANGTIACAYSDETRSRDHVPYSQLIGERISSDEGATWGPETIMVSQTGGGSQRPGMPVVAKMKNGTYGVIFEVVGLGNADVYFKTSADGRTWADGIGSPVPGQHVGPYFISLTTGRLLATSCQNVYSYSDDFGSNWHSVNPCPWSVGLIESWPAIYQTSSTEVAAMESVPQVLLKFGKLSR